MNSTALRSVPTAIWLLGLVSLLMDVSSGMIQTLLPIYLVTIMGASTLTVGIIEGTAEAAAAVVKIFSGGLSDKLGRRKPLAVFGYTLSAIAKPLFPLAASVGWLFLARFTDRIGKGIRGAPRDALIADISPQPVRGASFGLRQSLDTVGAFVGPGLAILLMWLFLDQFTTVFWLATIPAFLAAALILFAVREPDRPVDLEPAASPLSRAQLQRLGVDYWTVVAIAVIFTLARFSGAFLLLKAQSTGLPVTFVPLVMVVMNLVYALAAYPAGALSDRGSRMSILLPGLSVLILADLVLAFSINTIGVMIGVALWGLHMGLTQGLLSALIADSAPVQLRGTAFGMFNLLTGIALLCASILAGALWDWIGPQATFLSGAFFAAISLAGFAAHLRRRSPRDQH